MAHFRDGNHFGIGQRSLSLLCHTAVLMKNELRVFRAKRDMTQAELAELLGVSRQTVNAIETEKYDPSLPLAFKIARLFGKPIEMIFMPGEE